MLVLGGIYLRGNGKPGLFFLLVLTLLSYHVVVGVASDSIPAAFMSLLLHDRFVLVSLIVIFFLSHDGENLAIKLFIYGAIFTAYVAIGKILQNPSSILSLYGESGFSREDSIFPNSNMYGVYLASVVLLTLPHLGRVLFRSAKLDFIFVVSPLLVIEILTFSRRSWVALLVGGVAFMLFKRGRSFWLSVWLITIGSVFIWATDAVTIVDRFLLIFDSDYASNAERLEATADQFNMAMGSIPALVGGSGVGMFGPASMYSGYTRWGQIDGYYTQVVLEFGLLGLALYLSIFIYIVAVTVAYLRRRNISNESFNEALSYLITIAILYFVATVGSTPITFPLNLLQWMLIGFLVNHATSIRNEPTI